MQPATILLEYFTPFEMRVYFGKRTPEQLQAIADQVQAMTDDDRRAYREQLAHAYWQQHARKHSRKGKSVWGRLLVQAHKSGEL